MQRILIVLVVVCLLSPPVADAQQPRRPEFGDRRLKVIDDPLRVAFMGDPGRLTKAQVQQAVEIAAIAKDWKILGASDGRTELSATKNGRHVLHVVVMYDATGCAINYIDSVDMMYEEQRQRGRAVRVIHRNYNVWVRELADAIANKAGQPAKIDVAARTPPLVALKHNRQVPPASGYAAIGDVDKVPVRDAGKDRYRYWLTLQPPKAFVVTEKGGWYQYSRNGDAIAMAFDRCEQLKINCWLYAVDDRVVFTEDGAKRVSSVGQLPRVAP